MTTAVARRPSGPRIATPVHATDSAPTSVAMASRLCIEHVLNPFTAYLQTALDPPAGRVVPEDSAVERRQDLEPLGHDLRAVLEHERLRALRVDHEADLSAVLRIDQARLV